MGKVCSLDQVTRRRAALGQRGRVVVLTNGCFDLLHVGHVRYLRQARALGDCLIVGVNTDESVRRIKGPQRPVQGESDRAEILAALAAVDFVVLFGTDTAEQLVTELRPDIYVKGGDYAAASRAELMRILPEAKIVYSYGGQVQLLPFFPGKSTTEIIQRMAEDKL